ncbi:hypothetical protein EZMO1_0862 [Endozoicomonas montiporae CL-33]|uniref:Uncharacterized protein n=1 Tax=Endozoicomonas montiporae CL-33 TaxID=570277 RepID=A0A142B8K4_9GAMM|nr:hypothetical protein EZMO1_0862 [Endozoicomonas montiporae CL-33]
MPFTVKSMTSFTTGDSHSIYRLQEVEFISVKTAHSIRIKLRTKCQRIVSMIQVSNLPSWSSE